MSDGTDSDGLVGDRAVSDGCVRIAMWSGPRNISTAMMRAWENRTDTEVYDEPFYACYLKATGLDHPGRDEIIAHYPTDWRAVVAALVGPVPGGHKIYYQKHMTQHMLDPIGRDWLDGLVNVFLIRDPYRVVASYARVRSDVTADDLGFRQQREIFDRVRQRTGRVPLVIDAADVLRDPEGMLKRLCDAMGIPFSSRMLAWPTGRRDSDGLWAPHWYASVERSTGFAAPDTVDLGDLDPDLASIADACREHYDVLAAHRMTT